MVKSLFSYDDAAVINNFQVNLVNQSEIEKRTIWLSRTNRFSCQASYVSFSFALWGGAQQDIGILNHNKIKCPRLALGEQNFELLL